MAVAENNARRHNRDDWAGSIIYDVMIPKVIWCPVVVWTCRNVELCLLRAPYVPDIADIPESAQTDMFFV